MEEFKKDKTHDIDFLIKKYQNKINENSFLIAKTSEITDLDDPFHQSFAQDLYLKLIEENTKFQLILEVLKISKSKLENGT